MSALALGFNESNLLQAGQMRAHRGAGNCSCVGEFGGGQRATVHERAQDLCAAGFADNGSQS